MNAAAAVDDPIGIRHADAELLSLALIGARNHTLRWLAAFEARGAADATVLALAARAGAWQDRWIGCNLQRQRGEAADPAGVLLPAADAAIEAWLAGDAEAPEADALRSYLGATLETTLDLLGAADPGDAGLHFFRTALRHEDRLGEALAELAAERQLPDRRPPERGADEPEPPPWRTLPARAPREPLWFPARRFALGSPRGGCVPENERWQHEMDVPGFEIDAQVVNWDRYVEFAEDGGYDRRELWTVAGWDWLQSGPEARRAPRHVEQLRAGVLVQRRGRLQRVGAGQPVLHATRHEAEAWCRWAGRRLPTEPEWELAATAGSGRGFAWGDVFEWVAGSARAWPGYSAGAGALDALTSKESASVNGVLRGSSWMTPARQHHPRARRFAPPGSDIAFVGFRSCAL